LELMENDSPQTLQEKRKWRNRQGTETGSVYNNKYEVIKERLVALSVFPATSKQVVTPYKWWIALKFKGGRKKKGNSHFVLQQSGHIEHSTMCPTINSTQTPF
jgi:hypothetical protein